MESMASEPDPGIFGNNDFNSPERQQRFSAASSLTTYSTDDVMPSDSISVRRRPLPSPPRSDNPLPEPTTPPPARTSYDGLVSPRPRPAGERDALSSIVDRYDNPESELLYQRESQVTDTTDGDAYDGVVRESYIERTFASERANSAYSIEDDLRPPAPVFDLTPGREPSPARYKHGEPLHFVGEEEEYEYEFEQGNHYSSTHRF
jgi:hypothetical protein